jgi:hypothetical protein
VDIRLSPLPHVFRYFKILAADNNSIYIYIYPSHLSNTMAVKTLEVRPLKAPLGAEIYNVDVPNLSEEDFEIIRNALYNFHVVVLKNQSGVSPKDQ